jgi:hypothetical protein
MPKDPPPQKTETEDNDETPFERFHRLAQKIVSVRKSKDSQKGQDTSHRTFQLCHELGTLSYFIIGAK